MEINVIVYTHHTLAQITERELFSRKARTSCLTELGSTSRLEKCPKRRAAIENEFLRTLQSLILAACVLMLSYHGLRHGRTEYSLLEDGQTVHGYVPSHKAILTLSLGYSATYSVVSSMAACMLLYSLVSKKPCWSLPLLVLYLADLVRDVSDAIIAIWLYFGNLRLAMALFYASITSLLILGEMWVWFGVLRLYEHRALRL